MERAGDLANLVADVELPLHGRTDLSELRAIGLQPEAAGALPVVLDTRFG